MSRCAAHRFGTPNFERIGKSFAQSSTAHTVAVVGWFIIASTRHAARAATTRGCVAARDATRDFAMRACEVEMVAAKPLRGLVPSIDGNLSAARPPATVVRERKRQGAPVAWTRMPSATKSWRACA